MAYEYQVERPKIFTEEGTQMLLKVRSTVEQLIKKSGCFHADKAWAGVSGDSWTRIACLDYLVELGELSEVKRDTWGQYRIFERIKSL